MHLDEALQAYVVAHSKPLDEVQTALVARTSALGPESSMQIGAEQAQLLTILVRMLNASTAVEVGTFTGFSSIAIARGLAPGGRLLCCDVSEEWTSIARDAWKQAGVDDRIDLRIAPAAETLAALPVEEHIDFAFIDADKPGYWTYWTEIVPRLRRGGVIAVDNVLWAGRVVDPDAGDPSTLAMKEFNDRVAADSRVDVVMVPLGDGVTLAIKR
jgi:caffeoyl-CoA O-methyltransferase